MSAAGVLSDALTKKIEQLRTLIIGVSCCSMFAH
jgi:hypothetical protein